MLLYMYIPLVPDSVSFPSAQRDFPVHTTLLIDLPLVYIHASRNGITPHGELRLPTLNHLHHQGPILAHCPMVSSDTRPPHHSRQPDLIPEPRGRRPHHCWHSPSRLCDILALGCAGRVTELEDAHRERCNGAGVLSCRNPGGPGAGASGGSYRGATIPGFEWDHGYSSRGSPTPHRVMNKRVAAS